MSAMHNMERRMKEEEVVECLRTHQQPVTHVPVQENPERKKLHLKLTISIITLKSI